MKRIFTMLAAVCVATLAFAQNSSLVRPRMEVAAIESGNGDDVTTRLEVFYMDDDSPRMYYLSLGNLGIGTDIIQVDFDPAFELFIPLGNTLEEAIASMEEIRDYYALPKLSTVEITGNFAFVYPNDKPVTVTVTRRQNLLTKLLEFSIPAGGEDVVRATYVSKMDFNSILSSVKLYKKLHPNQN